MIVATDEDYRDLLAFRARLRRFERWSADQAEAHGLTSTQHQLLLAIGGYPVDGAGESGSDPADRHAAGPTIGEVSELLLLKHHSGVELVDRTQALGLVERVRDEVDHRRVRLRLTAAGADVLATLSDIHLAQVRRFAGGLPLPDVPA